MLRLVKAFVCSGAVLFAGSAPAFSEPLHLMWERLIGTRGGLGWELDLVCPSGAVLRMTRNEDLAEVRSWRRSSLYLSATAERESVIRGGYSDAWGPLEALGYLVGGTASKVWNVEGRAAVRVGNAGSLNPLCSLATGDPRDVADISGVFRNGGSISRVFYGVIGASGVYEWPPLVQIAVAANVALCVLWTGFVLTRRLLSVKTWADDRVDGRVARGQETAWQRRARRG